MFPFRNGLKKRGALSPLLFNFAIESAIMRVQVNQNGLKLRGSHQLLVYADDAQTLGGSVHTIKEKAEALVVASRETGLEANSDKTNYMVMYRDQYPRRNHSNKKDNSSFGRVEEFKYWEQP
jgi:hypothetical protein